MPPYHFGHLSIALLHVGRGEGWGIQSQYVEGVRVSSLINFVLMMNINRARVRWAPLPRSD